MRLREHVHRLHRRHPVTSVHQLQIPRLRRRVATHVHHSPRCCCQQRRHHVPVHPCPGRVRDHHVRLPVLHDKRLVKHVLHVPREEQRVPYPVQCRVHPGVLDGLRHVLDAHHPGGIPCHEIGNRTRKMVLIFAIATVVLYLLAGIWSYQFPGWNLVAEAPAGSYHTITGKTVEVIDHGLFDNYASMPPLIIVPVIAAVSMFLAGFFGFKGEALKGIIMSSMGIAFTIITAAVALFPFLMPSKIDPASSLTIWDATSSHFTLQCMLYAVVVFVPLTLGYTIFAYRRMWGKVSAKDVSESH